jgi:hypothetical protein
VGLRRAAIALAAAATFFVARPAQAFLFPEHSRITQAVLEELVTDAQVGPVLRELMVQPDLCPRDGDMNEWDCLRLVADLVAIAGDHSCSPAELVRLVHESNEMEGRRGEHWLWSVRRVGWEGDALLNGDNAENRRRLAVIDIATKGPAAAKQMRYSKVRPSVDLAEDRAFYRRRVNLHFQDVDAGYQSRAVVDGGHFQLPRQSGRIDLVTYLRQALAPDAQTNATALYATYHALALRLAALPNERETSLLAELFALHFLGDSFSSGHIVGHHGVDSWLLLKSEGVRMGTHDHYSDEGVEVVRWYDLASPYLAHGDGMMKPVDLGYASIAVKASLREVLEALASPEVARRRSAAYGAVSSSLTTAFDSCTERHPLLGLAALAIEEGPLNDVLALEPVPSPAVPEPPRFRAEAGLFFGASAAIDGGAATQDGAVGRARAAVRGGVGLNGLTIDPINSIAFVELGIVALGTNVASKAQANAGLTFRVRAPGLVTFIDGAVILGLLGAGVRTPSLIALGAKAGGGGIFPFVWQSHHIAGPWNFQVSALRDAAFNLSFRDNNRYRWEFQAPLLTFRTANPIAGIDWAQSNDFWIDLGFSAARGTEIPSGSFGFFLAISGSARSFP